MGLFAGRLRGMRKSITKEANGEKKKKAPKWDKHNPVRKQMKEDVVTGLIPDDLDFASARKLCSVYEDITDIELFKSRLSSMRKMVTEVKAQAKEDAEALENDRKIKPCPMHNARGEVQWIESEAKYFLEIDLEENRHLEDGMTPLKLYLSRSVYQRDCPNQDVFDGHLYQALKTRKWRNQWVDGKKEYALVPNPNKHSV